MKFTCAFCGSEGDRRSYAVKRAARNFCSIVCRRSFYGGKSNGAERIWVHKPDHKGANNSGYVREHILIAEEIIGRSLKPNEIVHHIDENPSNNNPDNLIVMTRAEHARLHKPTPPKRYSEHDLLAYIIGLANHLGRSPRFADVRKHHGPSHWSFEQRFGTWSGALRAAGIELDVFQRRRAKPAA